MNKKVKLIFFLVGLAIFIFLVNHFGLENIWENIKKTGWWLIPITAVWLIVYILNTVAFWFVLDSDRKKISFADIFSVTVSGFAINYITPVVNLGGEPYKVFALKERLGIHNAVYSVIMYSMLHFLSSFVFWIITIIIILITFSWGLELQLILGGLIFVSILGVLFFYSRSMNGIFIDLIKVISKLPFTKRLIEKIKTKEDSLSIIDDKIIDFYKNNKSKFHASLFFEVLARVVASVEFIFILKAVGITITIDEAIYINAAASLVMNIFFFVPLELGVREGGLYFVMNTLNFSSGIGIYIGLVNRIREFFWIFVGLILIQLTKSKRERKSISEYME